ILDHFSLGTCRSIADKKPAAKSGPIPKWRLNRVIWGRVKTPLSASSMGARSPINTSLASAQKAKQALGRITGTALRSIFSKADSTRGGGEKWHAEMVLIYRRLK